MRSATEEQKGFPGMSEQLVRLPNVLAKTGLTVGVLRGLARRGEVHPIRIGRAIYFDMQEVRNLIDDARRRREPATESSPMAA